MLNRRTFPHTGSHLCASVLAVSALAVSAQPAAGAGEGQRFLLVGIVGSENPTRANSLSPGRLRSGKLVMKSALNWRGTRAR
jgi:hypothetical protein